MNSLTLTFAGIEAECRVIQYLETPANAVEWWDKNFAHKYPDYMYDVVKERIVKRDSIRK